MRSQVILLLLLGAAVIGSLAGGGVLLYYNALSTSDEQVDGRWAQVEAALQRRADLVPSLVEVVKGSAAHEQAAIAKVSEARAQLLAGLKASAAAPERQDPAALAAQHGELRSALTQLLALAEQYPALKANRGFLTLQDQLEGSENRINVERMRYNEAVQLHNARLRRFPANLVGSIFGIRARAYFETEAGKDKAPQVQFEKTL